MTVEDTRTEPQSRLGGEGVPAGEAQAAGVGCSFGLDGGGGGSSEESRQERRHGHLGLQQPYE
ncbi:hypothetical protein [Streptomyces sp. NPDC051286]|uniref:hypothetical protein n=1 Tax=Streptomyces sp. NPDC051286 TaxID=3365647 RepID=UPI0037A7433E